MQDRVPLEGHALPVSFVAVEERLVEAVLMLWRLPDREKGWQRVKAMWPDVARDQAERGVGEGYADDGAVPPPLSLTRAEVGEMEEALSWMAFVPDRDRRLVSMAIVMLAKGAREVSWRRLLKPMGLSRGADGLRMRYGRALNAICVAVEARTSAADARQA